MWPMVRAYLGPCWSSASLDNPPRGTTASPWSEVRASDDYRAEKLGEDVGRSRTLEAGGMVKLCCWSARTMSFGQSLKWKSERPTECRLRHRRMTRPWS